jgi:mono/diheme cytochrome c family protein
MNLRKGIALIALAGLTGACSGLGGEPEIVATLPPQVSEQPISVPNAEPDLALGAQVFAANCTRCHGASGKGDGEFVKTGAVGAIIDFTDANAVQGKTPHQWYGIITNGKLDTLMPPWGETLSEEERWSVTMYLYSLSQPVTDRAQAVTPTAEIVGAVVGKIANGSSGGVIPGDLPVKLHVVDAARNDQVFEAVAGADGSYRFENVPLRSDREYIVTTFYSNSMFVSDILTAENPSAGELALPLTIYESANDPAVIQVNSLVTQVSATEDELQIVQIVSFTNTSDRVFVNNSETGQTSVGIPVPTGATYQTYMGGEYVLGADGTKVFETLPIVPNEPHLMHVAFTMPYTGSAGIQQAWDYPVAGRVEVLVGGKGLQLASDALLNLGERTMGSLSYTTYGVEALNLPVGESLAYTISGWTQTDTPATTGSPIAYLFIGFGLGTIGLAGALYLRERSLVKSRVVVEVDPKDLMKQIAELDVQFKAGKLDKARYNRERGALKTQLMQLMKTTE